MKCSTKRMAKGGELPDQSYEDVMEEKRRKAATKAYDKATTNTPAAPKKMAKGGMVKNRGYGMARGANKCKMV